MPTLRCAAFLGLLLLTVAVSRPADAQAPVQRDILRGRIAPWPDPAQRCPTLRQVDPEDDGVVVVLLVHVGSTGVPSQPSVTRSSQSADLDNDALACVMKLKFLPATRAGEGTPVESWQQVAWKRRNGGTAAAPAAAPSSSAMTATGAVAGSAAVAAAAAAGTVGVASSHAASAEVQVCVDATGKLVRDPTLSRPSGDAAFDSAAVAIARAGSGHYRSGAGGAAPGCVQLGIKSTGQ
jgi:TonB family protein